MKIYSPALITAKEKIVVGHGANWVWCDILARRNKQKGDNIDYFFPSWNHHGKGFDGIEKDKLECKLGDLENNLKIKLNLFGIDYYTEYRDSDSKSEENAQKYFSILQNKGFINRQDNGYFLDIQKIINQTDFVENLNQINFSNEHIKKRLLDLIKNLDGIYPISKPRDFATRISSNSNESQKINPIFDLAVSPLLFSEDSVDYSIDGSGTLLHGSFIPLVVWSGLFNKPFSKNICVHGYLTGNSNMDVEKFYGQIKSEGMDSDILRSCVVQCTDSFWDTQVNYDKIFRARKLFCKVINLSKHILKHYGIQKINECENDDLGKLIDNMDLMKAISYFESDVFATSSRIPKSGVINREDLSQFIKNIKTLSSVFPNTIKRTEEILYNGKL